MTGMQTDAGWGCMLRCGQMLLAETMIQGAAAAAAAAAASSGAGSVELSPKQQVLPQFADTSEARFSIHNVAMRGRIMDKQVGAWFGPNCMAQVMKSLLADTDPGFVVHVAMDSCLATDDVMALCTGDSGSWKPMLLLVPLRLGMDKPNQQYAAGLKRNFRLKQSVGAIGGRPNSAYYFVGAVEEDLLYLDPHVLQLSVGAIDTHTSLETYSRGTADRMALLSADPSLCLGFFCPTQADFDAVLQEAADLEQQGLSPLFAVVKQSIAVFDEASVSLLTIGSGDESDNDGFELI